MRVKTGTATCDACTSNTCQQLFELSNTTPSNRRLPATVRYRSTLEGRGHPSQFTSTPICKMPQATEHMAHGQWGQGQDPLPFTILFESFRSIELRCHLG